MIVITTPTGNIGHQVVENLLAADQPVRVIVRDPAKLPVGVRDRVEVVQGSHGDPDVVARAFAGAEALFWLPPGDPRAARIEDSYTGFTQPAAEAIRAYGVERVVSVSALGRGSAYAGQAGHVTASLAMDDLLASTGVAFRALANASFMDNVLRHVTPIREQGTIFDVLSSGTKGPWVATRDIASVATRLLADSEWTGQEELPLLGPEDLSYDDIAAILSEVLGKPVRYQQIPDEALKQQMLGFGASEAVTQALLDMMIAKENGLDLDVVRTAQNAIDTPTTFHRWVEDVLKPAVESRDATSRSGHGS
jgi:uncharacterized protein YbjT (DUF2867 family)